MGEDQDAQVAHDVAGELALHDGRNSLGNHRRDGRSEIHRGTPQHDVEVIVTGQHAVVNGNGDQCGSHLPEEGNQDGQQ